MVKRNFSFFHVLNSTRYLDALHSIAPGVKVNVLLNYFDNAADIDKYVNHPAVDKIFLDSGAFPAYSRGITIDIEEYTDFALDFQRRLGNRAFIAYLDVIGDAKASFANYTYQRSRGLSGYATWHVQSPTRELERLLDLGYESIAIGGVTALTRHQFSNMSFVVQRMTRVGQVLRQAVRNLHLFGSLSCHVLRIAPFTSSDAATAITASAFNCVLLYRKQSHCGIYKLMISRLSHSSFRQYRRLIRQNVALIKRTTGASLSAFGLSELRQARYRVVWNILSVEAIIRSGFLYQRK